MPKTPVGSFNKSNAHTPLVSPLTMIREEDLEVGTKLVLTAVQEYFLQNLKLLTITNYQFISQSGLYFPEYALMTNTYPTT